MFVEPKYTGLGFDWSNPFGVSIPAATPAPGGSDNPDDYPDPELIPEGQDDTSSTVTTVKPTKVPTVPVPQQAKSNIMNWIVGGGVIVMSFVAFKIYQNMQRKRRG
jgi:hypothetical protein